jgi:hypothetical protein
MPANLDVIIKNMLDISTIDLTRYVAPWNQTRWLVCSSLFFFVPCIYGFYMEQYFLAIISLLTATFSINFWRDANYSYRRTMDVIMAKIAFLIYMIKGVSYIVWPPFVITGYSALVGIIYCYYMSNKHGDTDLWWKYHMVFHLLIVYNQMIGIKSISDANAGYDEIYSNKEL